MADFKILSYNELPPFAELFKPDFQSGKLYWSELASNTRRGQEAGYIRDRRGGKGVKKKPYCMVTIDNNNNFNRGKILYFMYYGIWPLLIDHINGDSADDRISNLREISPSKNAWNAESRNKSGFLGVTQDKKGFIAAARLYGKHEYLGYFKTAEEASAAYQNFYKKYYGEDGATDFYLNIKQQTPEWDFIRQNRVTGTSAWKIIQGMSIDDVIAEKQSEKKFLGNSFTARGNILESEAIKLYSELTGQRTFQVGAVINTNYPRFLASPDSMVENTGGLECKCFNEVRQENVFENLDYKIICQIQLNLFLSQREWWDLILYNPEVKDISKAYHIKRFYPDEEIFEKFRQAHKSHSNQTEIIRLGLELGRTQNELEIQKEKLALELQNLQIKQEQINKLKEKLKDATTGKVKRTIQIGQNTLDISIYDTNRISVSDEAQVPEEYTTTVQVEKVFQGENGKFYQRIPNTKLAGNMYKAGKSLPPGFKVSTSRSISIKFNGETL